MDRKRIIARREQDPSGLRLTLIAGGGGVRYSRGVAYKQRGAKAVCWKFRYYA